MISKLFSFKNLKERGVEGGRRDRKWLEHLKSEEGVDLSITRKFKKLYDGFEIVNFFLLFRISCLYLTCL